jgi:glycosyltransferase involved in cell wall biosynthesis
MPRVSIGLPVRNGERHLARALDGLLAQRFADFELIVCDNVSTDDTVRIVERYAARDPRVRLHRNPANIGASPNFNRTFALASADSEYFQWAAHDDERDPEFLAACVAALNAEPRAVLAYTRAVVIDDAGVVLREGDRSPLLPPSDSPAERFAPAILEQHSCRMVFGVIRKAALARTRLHLSFDGSDRNLIAELALLGRFAHINRPLFRNRDHPGRYTRAVRLDPRNVMAWQQPDRAGQRVLHRWENFREYVAAVGRHVPDPAERRRCWGHLLRWQLANRNLPYMTAEALGVLSPRLFALARALRQRLGTG